MKRIWTAGLLLALLLVLAGCGGGHISAPEWEAAYQAITQDLNFTVTVEEPDGTATTLHITPETAENVKQQEACFSDGYKWSAAGAGDWRDQLAGERGNLMTLTSADGKTVLCCCSGGDVVYLCRNGMEVYARAVSPGEGEAPESRLYDALEIIARDAVSAGVWAVTADGSETDLEKAAAEIAEQAAEHYRNVPDWVSWKPLDVQAGDIAVYDVYRGELEQFCCHMSLRVRLEQADGRDASYWQAGAGLNGPDEEGYYTWETDVRIVKDRHGDWSCCDHGTGGLSVELPFEQEEARLEELVDAFYLTEGLTHDSVLPDYILQRPADSLRVLPQLLDKRKEAEAEALCRALGAALREHPGEWDWTAADLQAVMGRYAAYIHT